MTTLNDLQASIALAETAIADATVDISLSEINAYTARKHLTAATKALVTASAQIRELVKTP